MKLTIDCPECGYNSYLVTETLSGTEMNAIISKCPEGGCDLSIDNATHEHYEDFEELASFFNSRYEIVEITGTNCV